MEEKKVKLSKLIENPDNPRMISEFMLGKLTRLSEDAPYTTYYHQQGFCSLGWQPAPSSSEQHR